MRRAVLLAVVVTHAAACEPDYSEIEVEALTSPPVPVVVRSNEFEIPVGIAVAIRAEPVSSNSNDYDAADSFALKPEDKSKLAIDPMPEDYQFVLYGLKEGDTCVEVIINGSQKACVDALVTPLVGP